MFIPLWLIGAAAVIATAYHVWSIALARGRNPLPFPDCGSRIFAAASPRAKDAIVALLARHGLAGRFQVNTDGVLRSVLWDGTIINHSAPEVSAALGGATSSIGLVSANPAQSAQKAAVFLRERGCSAKIVFDAEPDRPIAFVLTDAMPATGLNFRKHVLHMPRPTKVA
jgi:hypothetical protein